MSPGCGVLRLTRTAVFSAAAVGLAVAAHDLGGGSVPVPVGLLAVPAMMLVVQLLAARKRSVTGLLAVLGVVQVLLHQVFMAVSGAAACQLGSSAEHPGSASHQVLVQCMPMTDHAPAGSSAGPAVMVLGHVLATLLTAILLARGDAAVWALAFWLAFRAQPLVAPFRLPVPPRAVVPRAPLRVVPRSAPARRALRRRGPPAGVVAVL